MLKLFDNRRLDRASFSLKTVSLIVSGRESPDKYLTLYNEIARQTKKRRMSRYHVHWVSLLLEVAYRDSEHTRDEIGGELPL